MRAIGFRAEKDAIHWAIVDGTAKEPKIAETGKERIPKVLDESEAMAWCRDTARSLIQRFKAEKTAIRFAETFLKFKPKPNVLASMLTRARIEGVLLEASHSCGLKATGGKMVNISAGLSSRRAKAYIESGQFRDIDLSDYPDCQQEAILVASSVLKG